MSLALSRFDVAHYVQTLCLVYTILIFAYIITQLIFSFGARVPYSRPANLVLDFLRDVSEPYLRIFRRFIPMIGPFDITPIIAVFVLQILCTVVTNIIRG